MKNWLICDDFNNFHIYIKVQCLEILQTKPKHRMVSISGKNTSTFRGKGHPVVNIKDNPLSLLDANDIYDRWVIFLNPVVSIHKYVYLSLL
jgi:hypothetical protein